MKRRLRFFGGLYELPICDISIFNTDRWEESPGHSFIENTKSDKEPPGEANVIHELPRFCRQL